MTLRAPFPWFGGKSRVAPLVWRAKHRPEEVAHWADWPVNEADLHARRRARSS